MQTARAKFGAATVKSTIYVLGLLGLFAPYLTTHFKVYLRGFFSNCRSFAFAGLGQ